MDQVTLIGHDDIASVPFHVRATQANMPWIRHTYYIVPSDESFAEQFRSVWETLDADCVAQCTVISEETLMDPAVCANKWIYQQLVKLSIDQLCESHGLSEVFLFTDIDTICTRPCTEELFRSGDKYIYSVAHYQGDESFSDTNCARVLPVDKLESIDGQLLSWLVGFSWTSLNLLQCAEMKCMSAVNACVIWSAPVLRALKKHLEATYSQRFYDSILACFRAFIDAHKEHFYQYRGFRRVVMTYYPTDDFEKVPYDPDRLFRELRVGFSEWQLYTYFLSICAEHPYCIQFDPPSKNAIIAEFNSEVQTLDQLRTFLRSRNGCHFVNFYPKLSSDIQDVLTDLHVSEPA